MSNVDPNERHPDYCPICGKLHKGPLHPMTGDGAVVCVDHARAYETATAWAQSPDGGINEYNLARAYLAQAAEIERRKVEAQVDSEQMAHFAKLLEASEASTVALLKALERYGGHEIDCATRYAEVDENIAELGCTCGLAAAKGETV
jgi:hypothetical protein